LNDAGIVLGAMLPVVLPGADVVWFDDFHCYKLDDGWGHGHDNPDLEVFTDHGVVVIRAEKYDEVWDGLGRMESGIRDGMGFLVLYRFREGTTGNLTMVTGTWQTPSNHSWMLALRYDAMQIAQWEGWEGTSWMEEEFRDGVLRPDVWFHLLIGMEGDGRLVSRIWEKDSPEHSVESGRLMDSGWVGRSWAGLFQVYEGTMELDWYMEVAFAYGE
jgi:hypothetical protein